LIWPVSFRPRRSTLERPADSSRWFRLY